MLKFNSVARPSRAVLLASVATASLFAATAASAQAVTKPSDYILDPQSATAPPATVAPSDPSIVITPPGTSVTDRDPTNITGVGQMIIDQKNGFIGLCTGTLINPRTVIFAAHCVNESPTGTAQDPWGYGTGATQLPIAFGFQANNNVAGNSAFGHYLTTHMTNVADFLYNVNQVQYNPHSLDLGLANNFIQADVAVASLDTPAANVPTWALLFSALPAPSSISDTTGTGYHVTIDGYGNTGTGTTGAVVGVDYRRRLAENYIGLLGSLDDIDVSLFGIAPRGRPQNLYQIDFDSNGNPNARTNQFDFNIFKDNALPGEGITGPGDSGGPLILDRTFAKQVVIAVLSGGTRYYTQQPSGAYGTSAFYQPLYLYWDYIAAANPYRYVGSLAGDGSWTDPTHWVTNLDPAYNIIVGGQLVNGVPTTTGGGITDTSGKFGKICFDSAAGSDCVDDRTGIEYINGQPVDTTLPTGTATQHDDSTRVLASEVGSDEFSGTASSGGVAGGKAKLTSITEAQNASTGTASVSDDATMGLDGQAVALAALPPATLANGLPGATNFVPNNIDPNAATKVNARYFDVTLAAAGTTTLSSTVTIDRLTLNGSAAKLTVNGGASLTSLININQLQGLVTNNGTITSAGDYFLLTGGITGTGRFNAPFFTSVSGMFMPGTAGTIGTLTFGGNLVLSSGTVQFIDLGAAGTSDRLAVVANGANPGIASIGGFVGFAPVSGYTIRAGDTFTILTAAGGISGTYSASALSAILTPRFVYSTNAVQVVIDAGLYANVVSSTSPVQRAYASLLDGDRASSYNNLSGLYGVLDLQNAATIQSTLEGLAPRTETLKDSIGTAAVDNMARFYRERVQSLRTGDLGGTLAVIGKPFQMASNAINALPGANEVRSDAGDTVMQQGKLPENMSAFLAGGYLNGKGQPMPTAIPAGGRDRFDGFFIGGGLETELGAHGVLGFALSYTDIDGDTTIGTQTARGELYQGTIYGKVDGPGGLYLDTAVSAGVLDSHTVRNVGLVGTPYRLTADDHALTFSGEVGVGKNFDLGSLVFGPRASFRSSYIGFSTVAENGGGPGLTIVRNALRSNQGRIGATLSGGGKIKPFASAYYVHDFDDAATGFNANFVGGLGPNATFALAGNDKDWEEVSGGLTVSTGKVDLSVSADTTIDRTDVSNQSYRGTIAFHF